ncbi:MAG: glycosyltransferase [Geobacter sp.]|nr:glycosyltransferase [Geobacter sp.]
MRILFIGDCEADYLAKCHEALRTGLRCSFDTRMFGKGYEGYDPSLKSYGEIIRHTFPDVRPDLLITAFDLTPPAFGLPFAGLDQAGVSSAIVLGDYWNVTEGNSDAFFRFLDDNRIAHVISYFPEPLRLFADSLYGQRFVNILPTFDPQLFNDWQSEKRYDVGFLAAGTTEPSPFYPERFAIHQALTAQKEFSYFSAPHPGWEYRSQPHPLVGKEFSKAINACRIFITTAGRLRHPNPKYFEILASRAALFAEEPDGAELLGLVDGVNYVKITSDTAVNTIRSYLAQPGRCEEIAEAGYRLAMQRHSCHARAQEFYRFFAPRLFNRTVELPLEIRSSAPVQPLPASGETAFSTPKRVGGLDLPEALLNDANQPQPVTLPPTMSELPLSSSPQYTLYRLIRHLKPRNILEIGSQIGASAVAMAFAMRDNGMPVDIVCIDPFLPTGDNDGLETFSEWYRHVTTSGQHEGIHLIISTADKALPKLSTTFDFILIDGSHEYEDVRHDFLKCLDIVNEGGYIWLHDFMIYESVRRACTEVLSLCRFPFHVNSIQRNARNELCGWVITRKVAPAANLQPTGPTSGDKLHIGCGQNYLPSHINIDTDKSVRADLYLDAMDIDRVFPPKSLTEILMIHSFNYLNLWQAREFLDKAALLLTDDGTLIIETPDLLKAASKISIEQGRNLGEYLEGVRALHAFDMGQVERHDAITPYACSWSSWHLEQELRRAGFGEISVLPPQTHAPWRDMRIEAKKGGVQHERKRTVLFVLDTALGHATAQVRGLALTESLTRSGWNVAVVDIRSTPLQAIIDQARSADIAYLLKVSFLEIVKALKSTTAKVVFDLSDALWTDYHRQHGWHDLDEILSTVDAVISDNPYVARYGEKFCKVVLIVPTATHVEKFAEYLAARPEKQEDSVVVGWIGSQGTAVGLNRLKGVLDRLAARHENLEIRIVGADRSVVPDFSSPRVTVVPEYDEQRMIEEVAAFDIGIFPPPLDLEDYVVRGALKALIYMSAGVPPVCFNAGECMDAISDGITGMLASTEKEWEEKLELLITSPQLRRTIGATARSQISSAHSLQKITDILTSTFECIILGREPEPAPEREPDQGIRVLAVYDIEGWAWWNRSQNIRRHLPTEVTLEMRRMDQLFDHRKYDFIMIFDPYLISLVQNVPPEKIIVGCSCPKYLEQTISLVTSARCAGGFLNNQEMFRQGSLEAPNIFCCQNGVDEELFHPATEPPEEPIACWVGNSDSVGEKGLDLIREACRQSGVRLVFLDREARRDMESLLTQEQVRDTVYHQATFYICASVVEGTPNPALEALACGLPVISTRVGNMPEIIRDGYNGFLVDRSVEALTAAIERLKAGDMHAMGRNARQSILDGWTWQQQVAKYAAMFSTLAKERSRYVGLNSAISLGMSLLEKGEFKHAEESFLQALQLDPQNPKARYGRILAAKQFAGNQ